VHLTRRSLAWAFLAVVVAAGIALAVGPFRRPALTARQIRQQLLLELQPVALENCTLIRVGSANDGGYLMCSNLLGNAQSAYSYGIGPADDWGCEISERRRIPLHQYDCFSPPLAGCPNGLSTFHNECVGPKAETNDGRTFDTIVNQIARNGDAGKTLVMKIDIEGAEQASVMATPDSVLDRVDQLAMEIHGTDARFLELIRKLKRTFHVVHLHYNNQACSVRYKPLPAWAYQVLLVNKRIGTLAAGKPAPTLPNPLDAPDYSMGHDCQTPWPIEP